MINIKMVVFGLLAVASTAVAQPERQIKLDIEINGDCASSRKAIDIVVDGDEGNGIPLTALDPAGHLWTTIWKDRRETKFPLAPLSASLRLNPGRTYCTIATPARDEHDALVARFAFRCDEQPVRDVWIATRPPIVVSYVRRLPKSKVADGPLACACLESGTFEGGEGTVKKIRFPAEDFRLQLDTLHGDVSRPGLLVMDALGKDPRAAAAAVLDPSVRRNGKNCNYLGANPADDGVFRESKPQGDDAAALGRRLHRHPPKSHTRNDDGVGSRGELRLCLQRNDLVQALREQAARGVGGVPPQFSPAAYDLDGTIFSRSKLVDLSLAVK